MSRLLSFLWLWLDNVTPSNKQSKTVQSWTCRCLQWHFPHFVCAMWACMDIYFIIWSAEWGRECEFKEISCINECKWGARGRRTKRASAGERRVQVRVRGRGTQEGRVRLQVGGICECRRGKGASAGRECRGSEGCECRRGKFASPREWGVHGKWGIWPKRSEILRMRRRKKI